MLIIVLSFTFFSNLFASQLFNGNGQPGVQANVIESRYGYTKIEFVFGGYASDEIKINGNTYLSLMASDMTWLMEKGKPQLLSFRKSLLIPDNTGMNYRIISQEIDEVNTLPIMPSKGHFTRDIDPNSIPYIFGDIYSKDEWYPSKLISLDEPYIVRDFRGQTVQFNPMQYNAVQKKLRVVKRIVIEVYSDNSLQVRNPLLRYYPMNKVSSEFAGIYRGIFMNYGVGEIRFDSIPEPGRMLVIYASQYASTITPFVQWKQGRGLTVLTADYPAQTGSGR
ncbi:MAG: hypothetical protein NTV87_11930 [Ignavibacteriae bacterium]|nr:hypothetical protein [Ignavibacteriota bacterium]